MTDAPTKTPAEWLRIMHKQAGTEQRQPWAQVSFRHAAPRAGGPGCPAHLLYEARLIYPGTAEVRVNGETVAASRPGYLDAHTDYNPPPGDPYTHDERVKLLSKAAGLLLKDMSHVYVWWPIRSSERRVIGHGAVHLTGSVAAVMVVDPCTGPDGSDRVFAVAVPGRPAVVDEAATAAAQAAAIGTGGRYV